MPAESDITAPPRWWQRRLVRLLLAVTCVTTLLCGGGAWWWTSRPDFGGVVREAGGRYRRETVGGTFLGVLSNLINRRPTTDFHWIWFAPGNVDDAWLHAHREEIGSLSYVLLFLRDTRVTGEGLAALRGMQNMHYLDLTGTALDDADVDHVTTLPGLAQLFVGRTGISDRALADLSSLPRLSVIGIDSSQATPKGITALAAYPRLSTVMLVDANDASVSQVSELTGLVGVILVGEEITAASLPALKQMQGLQVLTLYDAQLTDEQLQELQQALPGCTVQQMPYDVIEQIEESQCD